MQSTRSYGQERDEKSPKGSLCWLDFFIITDDELIAGGTGWRKLGLLELLGIVQHPFFCFFAGSASSPFLLFPFFCFFAGSASFLSPSHPRCFLMRPLGTFVWPWFPCLPYCFASCSPLFNIDFVMVHLILGHPHLETAPTLESLQQEADVINGMNIKKAFEFIEGPAHKLHVVLIYDLCIVVGVVH